MSYDETLLIVIKCRSRYLSPTLKPSPRCSANAFIRFVLNEKSIHDRIMIIFFRLNFIYFTTIMKQIITTNTTTFRWHRCSLRVEGGGRPDTGWKPTCLTKWPHVNLTCWTGFQTWIAVLRQGMHYHRASRTAIVLSCMYSQKLFSHQWFCGFIELLHKSAPRGTQVPVLCSRNVPQIFTTVSVSLIPNWFYGPIAVLNDGQQFV